MFPNDRSAIPEDYLIDETTGLRPKQTKKPYGVSKTYLNEGLKSSTLLPPEEMWNRGFWFQMLNVEQQAALETTVTLKDAWNSFIVNGEGTPGNFNLRIYVVPDEIAKEQDPLHPLLWSEKLRTPVYTSYTGYQAWDSGTGWGTDWRYDTTPKTTQAQPQAVKAPGLPAGIRFRCPGCGHWFKEQGLAPHTTHCCPGNEDSGETDWALLCECCLTLDEVSACKPGFPRPKKEVKKETEELADTAVAS